MKKRYVTYLGILLLIIVAVMSVLLFNTGFGGKTVVSENSGAETAGSQTETVSQ